MTCVVAGSTWRVLPKKYDATLGRSDELAAAYGDPRLC
jgi:hypothetical protein